MTFQFSEVIFSLKTSNSEINLKISMKIGLRNVIKIIQSINNFIKIIWSEIQANIFNRFSTCLKEFNKS